MSNLIPGFKTYTGLAITLIGALAQQLGWGWWQDIASDVPNIINMGLEFVGLVIATYGRAVAKPKTA